MSSEQSANQAYALDDQLSQYTRLRNFASVFTEDVAMACQLAGISTGSKIADIGCGPLGAMLTLSDIVGPSGTVVGIDQNPEALETSADIVRQAGRANVAFSIADINAVDPRAVAGGQPFDAAYCRLVLVHQKQPEAALQKIAQLVCPGGHIILHECLIDPSYPQFLPEVPATVQYGKWLLALGEAIGASFDAPRHFSAICRAADLQEVRQRALSANIE